MTEGNVIAASGGRTQLHRVTDLISKGHSLESIRAWCTKEIDRLEKKT